MKFFVTPSPEDKDYSKRCFDRDTLKKFKAIINVSDTECLSFELQPEVPSFWFPIHEVWHWGYAPFYGAAKVVDHYGPKGAVLFHCHAGVNRSACVALALKLADGLKPEEITLPPFHKGHELISLFNNNIKRGYIPHDIIPFLQARKEKPTYGIMGLLQVIESPALYLKATRGVDGGRGEMYNMCPYCGQHRGAKNDGPCPHCNKN